MVFLTTALYCFYEPKKGRSIDESALRKDLEEIVSLLNKHMTPVFETYQKYLRDMDALQKCASVALSYAYRGLYRIIHDKLRKYPFSRYALYCAIFVGKQVEETRKIKEIMEFYLTMPPFYKPFEKYVKAVETFEVPVSIPLLP